MPKLPPLFSTARGLAGLGARLAWSFARENAGLSLLAITSAVMAVAVLIVVILPGYTSPSSRISTSKFGYPSLFRKIGRKLPVSATSPERRRLTYSALGEGLVRSEPTVISIVPMGKIAKVLVKEGDLVKKGQLVAEVDSTKARIKVNAARAALETARAELERVKIGSAYVLEKERPERDTIRLEGAEKEAEYRRQLIDMEMALGQKGYGSKANILEQKIALTQLEASIREARFNLGMSTKGVAQSIVVAESAVREAELAVAHREVELADHKVFANADGLVERCLVREGEYNQDPGKPGFLVAAGSWFEANFDQGAVDRVSVGAQAKVRLEAFADRAFPGRVDFIHPFVKYDLGGPESTRPIRPLGTGAPEWPATFAVRIPIDPGAARVLPGMTGFAVIGSEIDALCLKRNAVTALTGGKAIVYKINGDRFEPKEVTVGIVDGDWIQIKSGIDPADEIILDGYQVLDPKDRIEVRREPTPGAKGAI